MDTKVMYLPFSKQEDSTLATNHGRNKLTAGEVLDILTDLIQTDAKAYFSLKAICLFEKTLKIDSKTKEKLFKLRLVDKKGNAPFIVTYVVISVIEKQILYNTQVL